MEYLKLAENKTEFERLTSQDSTLPIVIGAKDSNNVFMMSSERVLSVLDNILDGEEGTETEETDYVKQIDEILS